MLLRSLIVGCCLLLVALQAGAAGFAGSAAPGSADATIDTVDAIHAHCADDAGPDATECCGSCVPGTAVSDATPVLREPGQRDARAVWTGSRHAPHFPELPTRPPLVGFA